MLLILPISTLAKDADRESTLSVTRSRLLTAVGFYLDYGRDPAQWSTEQTKDVDESVDSGIRQVYFTDYNEGVTAYQWSFLQPTTTLAIVGGQQDYDLPRSFGGLIGPMTFQNNFWGVTITQVPEPRLRAMRQVVSSGIPRSVAIRIHASADQGGHVPQRYQAMFWPKPDGSYTLEYSYRILPAALSDYLAHPLGGAAMAEVMLQSCLAAAERLIEDDPAGRHNQRFLTMLSAAISADRAAHEPDSYGFCRDPSVHAGDWHGLDRRARMASPTVYIPGSW